ncbi:MAG TPA: hypothetical protein VH477_11995 [Bryobacteraceae bacterium]
MSVLCFASGSAVRAEMNPLSPAESETIIDKYLQATGDHPAPAEASVEVDINASIPKLKEDGRLHALRIMSRLGRTSYRVLGFQGSNTVKNQVIARYLQAEQQNQGNPKFAVTPANYKFKFKGERITDEGKRVYVFALTPRTKAIGLFKGELWLDQSSYLPVFEKGRLSKNPSIFFKKVDFERAFVIQNGEAVPQRINSIISTRLVGRVELNVTYSNYAESPYPEIEANSPGVGNLSSR